MADTNEKKAARAHFLSKRLSLSPIERHLLDAELVNQISALDEFKQCDTVLLYASTKNEPNFSRLALRAWELGKGVAFPISLTDTCELDFRLIDSLTDLESGAYGIYEPTADRPVAAFTEKTLCIVPALAIDSHGFRLGYGKGYYDRFLKNFKGISLSAVDSRFTVDTLPTYPTDIPVDIIITETGVVHLK